MRLKWLILFLFWVGGWASADEFKGSLQLVSGPKVTVQGGWAEYHPNGYVRVILVPYKVTSHMVDETRPRLELHAWCQDPAAKGTVRVERMLLHMARLDVYTAKEPEAQYSWTTPAAAKQVLQHLELNGTRLELSSQCTGAKPERRGQPQGTWSLRVHCTVDKK